MVWKKKKEVRIIVKGKRELLIIAGRFCLVAHRTPDVVYVGASSIICGERPMPNFFF